MQPSYKNAYNCKRCPQNNGPDGCPNWIEITMTQAESGMVKVEKDCVAQFMPMLIVELIKASNRPAEELSSMRGEMRREIKACVEETVQKMAMVMNQHVKLLEASPDANPQV